MSLERSSVSTRGSSAMPSTQPVMQLAFPGLACATMTILMSRFTMRRKTQVPISATRIEGRLALKGLDDQRSTRKMKEIE